MECNVDEIFVFFVAMNKGYVICDGGNGLNCFLQIKKNKKSNLSVAFFLVVIFTILIFVCVFLFAFKFNHNITVWFVAFAFGFNTV